MAPLAAHVIITGRVQGVCYRLATQQEAQRLALAGWVRNLPSGQVEAVFEGDRDALEDMVLWCHQGPSQARVTQVALHWHVAQGYDSFTIRP
ncbi:acylphosphatase [Prochlorothrix hollandica PCC 9006 = CALU 1027]|uniref:acylphosphatase n=1 Tax=Prochlorothrix hollandica PCC 9006 = CALU 1027 TaxID=317619 RepID=A0A0M2PPR4_PROHO|nr:acylphosphatase [Prochlorothrix hollandica PCC 9006 = CALU 1027]